MHISQGRATTRMFVAVLILVLAAAMAAAQQSPAAPAKRSPFLVAFQAALPIGLVNTAILIPGDGGGGMNPIDAGWGMGVEIEYAVAPYLRVFADGNYFTYKKQVGIAGQYSFSDWVWEMTGYGSNQLGPFDKDAYFYMDATGFRAGAKLVLPAGRFAPWVGAAYGYYMWTATYGTADRSGMWGQATGYLWGLTYLAGVDWNLALSPGNDMILRVYADLASPVAFPVIENLFNPGWTWDNSGGNHIMGPYRFGIALGMPL
jgi:hypothetical protein